MDLAPFIALLQQTIGLDAASIGPSAVERAVRDQLAASKMEPSAYLQLLHGSEGAMQALIEAVVVPETWFFRDREAFAALARTAWEEWLRVRPDSPLRLLSVPCSTGEEPYSMAMALLDAGLAPDQFEVDAVDISTRALTVAQRGIYGSNAFRGSDLAFRDRYFTPTPAGVRLDNTVRQQVRFQHGNLFAPGFLPGTAIYDALFCRNVLIYFDRPTQDRCVAILQRLMRADGVVFVGPSESSLLLDHHFVPARIPLAFAFRKRAALLPAPVAAPRPVRPLPPVPPLRVTGKPHRPVPAAPGIKPAPPSIDEAARLADQGRLAEAATCCEAYIRHNGASAAAFYLMGLIRDAGGELVEAERQYRKALYLDQGHQEALAHLALLLERQGKPDAARLLRHRAARAGRG